MPRVPLPPLILLLIAVSGGLGACGADSTEPEEERTRASDAAPEVRELIAAVVPRRGELALVDSQRGPVARIGVGASPWGIDIAGDRAYVSTARHVAVVDLGRRVVIDRVPYREPPDSADLGEDREGGMGIAVAPDGRRVYVGLNLANGGGRLDVLDTLQGRMVASVPIGERPFDVLVAPDGSSAFTVDHDSYGVTRVNTRTLESDFLAVAPLGQGAFDKLNYGAVDARGKLLLPVNGEVLTVLDPRNGRLRERSLSADVHQAGVTISRGRLLTVGAESLGGGSPNLSIYDLDSGRERVIQLTRPHEDVAVGSGGRVAYLSGGYTRGGWEGITAVTLDSGNTREIPLEGEPLGIAVILPRASER